MNPSLSVISSEPGPATRTLTSTGPALWAAGVSAIRASGVRRIRWAVAPPKSTIGFGPKVVPAMGSIRTVTEVPPATGPLAGSIVIRW